MGSLKAHEVDRFLQGQTLPNTLYLIYGPDAGLVRERGRTIAAHFQSATPEPHNLVSLDASELDGDPQRLSVEARTSSLFGGPPVVRVRNATKAISAMLEPLLADWPDAPVIIETVSLSPKDKLRALVEKSEHGLAIPCFSDTAEARARLIADTFAAEGISIDSDASLRLRDLLGNDREVTRRELEKLVTYAMDSKVLTLEDIEALCGNNAATSIDEVIDAVGTGHLGELEHRLNGAAAMGIEHQRILAAALNHFTWLREKLAEARTSGKRPIDVMNSGWPKPHFSRRSALELQARLWSDQNLAMASGRLYRTILATRRNPGLADALTSRTLLALAAQAAKR